VTVRYRRRQPVDLAHLQELFERAWGGAGGKPGYQQVLERSFTWVSAHDDDRLVGFVNVAWDGGVHLFLLDTTVDPEYQHRGIGTALVRGAVDACRGRGEWLHVDSSDELMASFYVPAGFSPTSAGLLSLVP
jgi:ribosomal protein S18 acetylase RimI-like enzyme